MHSRCSALRSPNFLGGIRPDPRHIPNMAFIRIRPSWELPSHRITPESIHQERRRFLRQMGFLGSGLVLGSAAWAQGTNAPAPRNPVYNPSLALSPEKLVTTYNNYYEFSTTKDRVHRLVGNFKVDPWTLSVGGLCEKPANFNLADLAAIAPAEERVYRFRCVEAWSMVVPWTGFPLAKLLEKVVPKPGARFVRFQTVLRPDEMPGIARLPDYPWPYTEGLRLDEAMHPLVLLATGLYGKPMPKQNGAPVRLVVPWKYGFKSIKSVVKIDLVESQPATLWESLAPNEYPFESNVEPTVPHPRWSQATERDLGTGQRIPTLPYNGYSLEVAHLYPRR
jgi:sulfoxide reductase catalytic subunit YedY